MTNTVGAPKPSDAEHALIIVSEELKALMMAGNFDAPDHILEQLKGYITSSIDTHEEQLRAGGYPDIDRHKHQKAHKAFRECIMAFYREHDAGKTVDSFELNLQILKYYGEHVLKEDKAAADYIETHKSVD